MHLHIKGNYVKKLLSLIVATVAIVALSSASTAAAYEPSPEKLLWDIVENGDISSIIVTTELSVDNFAALHGFPKPNWNNIPSGELVMMPEKCGRVGFSDSMFGFCRADNTVYIGEDMAEMLRLQTHPLAPAVTIAHEFGHHLQLLKGWKPNSQQLEDGADCVAGAWLSWFNNQTGSMLSGDDFLGISRLVVFISKQHEGDVHGTVMDRGLALLKGYDEGLHGCNVYTPTI